MTLQNLEIKGKKARYDWINPFDKIAFYASRQSWLALANDFSKLDWSKAFKYPEVTLKQIEELLSTV